MDYEGIYYCVRCGAPMHISGIMYRKICECGSSGFISCVDFNIKEALNKYAEETEQNQSMA